MREVIHVLFRSAHPATTCSNAASTVVVQPHERTIASGITNLVRMAAWAVGPFLAGALMQGRALLLPLVAGALLKILYDVMLYRAFRSVRPPEEEEELAA